MVCVTTRCLRVRNLGFGVLMSMLMSTFPMNAQRVEDPASQIRWDLRELYNDVDAWRAEKVLLDKRVDSLVRFRGKLGESADALADAFDTISETEKELVRLYVFAFLRKPSHQQ